MRKNSTKLFSICILSLTLMYCGSKKSATTAGKDAKTEVYEATRISSKEVLSEDGSKIVNIPVVAFTGTGSKNNSKAIAEESAKTRVSNAFARSIQNTLQAKLEEKTASMDGQSVTVIRDQISSMTNTVVKALKIGTVKTTLDNGYYTSNVEVYMSGKEYKNLLKNASESVKNSLVSDKKIENAKDVFKAVDAIFDGKMD